MARPKTPNAIHKLTGSKHVRKDEPEFEAGLGKPPPEIHGRSLQVWHEMVAELKKVGIGSRVEAHALAEYCDAVAQSEECRKILKAEGLVATTERGLTRHPASMIQAAASLRILKFASEFGFTPSSRGKIHGPPKEEKNDFSEF